MHDFDREDRFDYLACKEQVHEMLADKASSAHVTIKYLVKNPKCELYNNPDHMHGILWLADIHLKDIAVLHKRHMALDAQEKKAAAVEEAKTSEQGEQG